jgi:hypothetical protein
MNKPIGVSVLVGAIVVFGLAGPLAAQASDSDPQTATIDGIRVTMHSHTVSTAAELHRFLLSSTPMTINVNVDTGKVLAVEDSPVGSTPDWARNVAPGIPFGFVNTHRP